MTETLTPPVTPLTFLFDLVATSARRAQEEESREAVTAADEHVFRAYRDTLGEAFEQHEWSGCPALRDNGLEPSAVAPVGGGLWLHHTITTDDDYRDVLTLLVPCSCGRGYVDWQLENEQDLLEILTDLRRTDGRGVHGDPDNPDCATNVSPAGSRR
ncbi:hypothetical protein ACLQ2C_36665 [Streptomyces sp. DT73]|uniref:hypothetical protein n=1 Tax=Streptomyces sp. DT73 TaxID=3393420 RepID=UPI003CE6AE02